MGLHFFYTILGGFLNICVIALVVKGVSGLEGIVLFEGLGL